MPKKWIVLLDVDETCVMSNSLYGQYDGGYRYHEPLFQALKRANLTQVYLFTSYSLRGIAKNNKEEPVGAPSRLKLIRYLTENGIEVLGVLTLLDVVFGQGIGAFYERMIRHYEQQVLEGIDLNQKGAREPYLVSCEQEDKFRKIADEARIDKGSLYAYLVQQLEQNLLQNNFAFIVVDDRPIHLESVQKQNERCRYPLLPLQARPRSTVDDYLKPLVQLTQTLASQEVKSRLEQAANRVTKKQQEEYQALLKRVQSNELSTEKSNLELIQTIERFLIGLEASIEPLPLAAPLPGSVPTTRTLSWPEPDEEA